MTVIDVSQLWLAVVIGLVVVCLTISLVFKIANFIENFPAALCRWWQLKTKRHTKQADFSRVHLPTGEPGIHAQWTDYSGTFSQEKQK